VEAVEPVVVGTDLQPVGPVVDRLAEEGEIPGPAVSERQQLQMDSVPLGLAVPVAAAAA
jgi:hypothetical protein